MGELPVYTSHAHVFTIDPKTKKTWIPSSTASVEINYFFDPTKSCYRIVSIEDVDNSKKVVINSTLTERMVFKKTSQKFGQWSDSKQGTIFGLGFNSESDLDGFVEQFKKCVEYMKKKSVMNAGDSNKESTNTIKVLQDPVGVTNNNSNLQGHINNSGRPWEKSPSNLSNSGNARITTLELELEQLTKRMDEMRIQHKLELDQMREEMDQTNNGALSSSVENVKTVKDLRSRIAELEMENKEMKKKLKEIAISGGESKSICAALTDITLAHRQMGSLLTQASSYHNIIGKKLSDVISNSSQSTPAAPLGSNSDNKISSGTNAYGL